MKNIVIVEGFDGVEKTSYIEKNLKGYKPCYLTYDLINKINKEFSWVVDYEFIEAIAQKPPSSKVLISGGLFTNYVYNKLYSAIELPEPVYDWYKSNLFLHNQVSIIHVRHRDKSTAQAIYRFKKQPGKFNSFDEYWAMYISAEKLYNEMYKKSELKPMEIATYMSLDGSFLWGVSK